MLASMSWPRVCLVPVLRLMGDARVGLQKQGRSFATPRERLRRPPPAGPPGPARASRFLLQP